MSSGHQPAAVALKTSSVIVAAAFVVGVVGVVSWIMVISPQR